MLGKLWGLFRTQQLVGDMEDPGDKYACQSGLVGISCLKTRKRCDCSLKAVYGGMILGDEDSSLP